MSKTAYEEVLDFITSTPSLEEIIAFEHSSATVERVNYLIQSADEDTLSEKEREELKEFSRANELMEQLKVRARRRLGMGEE